MTMATIAPGEVRARRDDRFFVTSAFVMAAVVVAGFGLQFAMGRSTLAAPPLIHLHAVVFMGWVAIYVAQNWLAATGHFEGHKTLGWVASVWAIAMVVLGILVTVLMVRRGAAPFFFQPAYFLVMNPASILTFAALTGAAIVNRRRTAWHKRLHFCGMAVLLGPAIGRLLPMPLLIPHAGEWVFAVLILFPFAGMLADRRRQGRVHPAWFYGLGAITAMMVAINLVTFSPVGAALYEVVTAGAPGAAVDPYAFPLPPPMG